MAESEHEDGSRSKWAWLLELPEPSERTMRMESLIARIRLMVLLVNAVVLGALLDTSGMQTDAAWLCISVALVYAIPTAVLEPWRRWRLFQTSLLTAVLDSLAIAWMVAATGASESPFFVLYFLSVAAVAMRFDLRQALVASFWYALTYALVFAWTWEPGSNGIGVLTLRLSYMFFIAVGVGHLAREEYSRWRQVDEIGRLNAENQRLANRNERAAKYDRLTGILNRSYFEKEALRELRKLRGSNGYLSVLFCDMDRLKRVNDEAGHETGDRVLRQVASAMRKHLRSNDLIGRYGGDEFVVILPSLTRETAFDCADQLVAAVRGVNDLLPEQLHIGLSVGIATYPFDAQDYPTLVRLADQAMYLAKRAGGDRVRTANDLRLFWEEMPNTA